MKGLITIQIIICNLEFNEELYTEVSHSVPIFIIVNPKLIFKKEGNVYDVKDGSHVTYIA
jgi:hypothetical protein